MTPQGSPTESPQEVRKTGRITRGGPFFTPGRPPPSSVRKGVGGRPELRAGAGYSSIPLSRPARLGGAGAVVVCVADRHACVRRDDRRRRRGGHGAGRGRQAVHEAQLRRALGARPPAAAAGPRGQRGAGQAASRVHPEALPALGPKRMTA